MRVYSYYQKGDKKKKVKKGFCWTMFFFGWIVPLFRLDIGYLLMLGILEIALTVLGFPTGGISLFGVFVINLILSFNYNQHYCLKLERKGFKPIDKDIFSGIVQPVATPAPQA